MPFACLKSVREVSSEDIVHSAANLLQQNPGKKWKTKSSGDKAAYVILELDEPCQISGIDIGNEHSAFVEVQVGKEGCTREAFSDILITCSFMTPIESKNSTNVNRVRCFAQDALVETALPTKWKLVKVICSQPFNKHVQFGLSFIKIHIVENAARKESVSKSLVPEKFLPRKCSTDSNENKPKGITLGKFNLREDSPDSESESATGLFNRWKMSRNKTNDSPPTTAAAIRQASTTAALSKSFKSKPTLSPRSSTNTQIKTGNDEKQILDRNRELLLFGSEDDEVPNKLFERKIEVDRERLRIENEKLKGEKERTKESGKEGHAKPSARNVEKPAEVVPSKPTNSFSSEKSKKRHSSPTSGLAKKIRIGNIKYLPFNQLLKGVCLVISGIQNPDRAELRRKALDMGAKYKADWENGCTHLICAYKNTPKYNQVKGKGKIVTRSWVEKCYSMKKYLPWRRFALESLELTKAESDEEILDESQKPGNEIFDKDDERPSTSHVQRHVKDKTLNIYDLGDADEKDSERIKSQSQAYDITSGSDTEDEILKATIANQKRASTGSNKENENKDKDIYEITTEEEDFLKEKIQNCSKKLFFSGLRFFICEDISVVDKIKVEKSIEQYGGVLSSELLNVQYAITNKSLNDKDEMKFTGEAIKPLWIFECSDMEVKVPTTRYKI